MSNLRVKIGCQIKEMRKNKGISQKDLAERAGIDRGNMSKVESGQCNATVDVLERIFEVLGIDFNIVDKDI